MHIEMPVEKDGLLAGIIPDLSQNCWGQLQFLPVTYVGSEIDELCLHSETLEMIIQEMGHLEDIRSASGIPAYAADCIAIQLRNLAD